MPTKVDNFCLVSSFFLSGKIEHVEPKDPRSSSWQKNGGG